MCPGFSLVLAQDFDRYEFRHQQLADNLYLLMGAGGNVAACFGEDGVLLVDDDYEEMSAKLVAAVAEISEQPVRFVFNTHWHFDHVGGNEHLAGTGTVIVGHENIRRRMAAGQLITIIDSEVESYPEPALPVVTYAVAIAFHLNGEEISIFHAPHAHTDGDGVVQFRNANVIHTGDVYFNGGYPFIDVSSGGTINGMIAAVTAILERCNDETRIIPGHGPLASKADFETYLAVLTEFRDIIAAEVAKGKDLETIVAEQPTAALDEKWGKTIFPPDQFTKMVYLTLPEE